MPNPFFLNPLTVWPLVYPFSFLKFAQEIWEHAPDFKGGLILEMHIHPGQTGRSDKED